MNVSSINQTVEYDNRILILIITLHVTIFCCHVSVPSLITAALSGLLNCRSLVCSSALSFSSVRLKEAFVPQFVLLQ